MHYAVGRSEEVLGALPVAVRDRAAASRLPPWRAEEYAAARTLLRALLREVGADLEGGPVAAHPSGRPYLPARPDLGVSLSHSSGWVAAAVGRDRDVGVDVQTPVRASDRLLRLCCSRADAEALAAMPENRRRSEFAWIFTVQEACVKTVGRGLSGRPWSVPVALGQQAGAWGRVSWRAPREGEPVPVGCAWNERLAACS
ncbi:4'-phosphopantetheinyl transferase superfamily protein [Streptomyces sp. SID8374]|uniref:4'-phosphopantetheinyl transferase superfamily protein n=1 Tax=Streptomyces sp. SID8374 TaxID=2690354 RepID=UPI00136D87F7|nr:4'-phosphopantetheinyl transferase superfamily protein [Streptomyces sp. SID8374]